MVEELFELSRRDGAAILARIREANRLVGLHDESMEIDYDAETDYLSITFGEPRVALALSLDNQAPAVLMYDPDTFEICAIEVPFFMEFREKGAMHAEFWAVIVRLLEGYGPTVSVLGKGDLESVERAFHVLISA